MHVYNFGKKKSKLLHSLHSLFVYGIVCITLFFSYKSIPVITENNGSKVLLVSDDSTNSLIHCSSGLLPVPFPSTQRLQQQRKHFKMLI